MNSREKAQQFICFENEPDDTDLADIDTLAGILDQHAEEQRQMCADEVAKIVRLYWLRNPKKELIDACLNRNCSKWGLL